MQTLTHALATQRETVRQVVLDEGLCVYVRRLGGDDLAALVDAIGRTPGERAARLTALCVCDSDGAQIADLPDDIDGRTAAVREWPPVWLVKLADEAGRVNGLYLEGGDPETEPDAL